MPLKRKRIRDKYQIGRSSLVPYIESEGWRDRHYRRKMEALKHEEDIRKWCNVHRWIMSIKNNGHHWIFLTHQHKRIEWFPSTGKLAIGQQWVNGIHCHDYQQLLEVFEIAMEVKENK